MVPYVNGFKYGDLFCVNRDLPIAMTDELARAWKEFEETIGWVDSLLLLAKEKKLKVERLIREAEDERRGKASG